MRVNFNGSFKDVQKLLSVPQIRQEGTADFGPLLSSISPEAGQPAVKTVDILTNGQAEDLTNIASKAKASISWSSPELISPQPDLITNATFETTTTKIETVKESPIHVKTPTILSAKRVQEGASGISTAKQEKVNKVLPFVEEAASKYGIDPALSLAVIENESSFNHKAVSSDGFQSKGLMQLLDTTGKEEHARNGAIGPYRPFDPKTNVDLGVSYLRRLHEMFSSNTDLPRNMKTVAAANSVSLEKFAVAAFNAGEGRVASAQSRAQKSGGNPTEYEDVESYLPDSTQEYVKKVMAARLSYEGEKIG